MCSSLYVVGDGPNLRNFVLAHGALGPLLGLIQLDINVRKYDVDDNLHSLS